MIRSKTIEEKYPTENLDMLPVILTCPHDGDFIPRGVNERNPSKFPTKCQRNFQLLGDLHTTRLANEIADNIYMLSKKNVYVEIGIIKRDRCDLNRIPECAYETSLEALPAQLCYYRYHNSILSKIKDIQNQNYFNHKLGILIDIHGFVTTKKLTADFIIGTENGDTLKAASQLNIDIKWHPTNGFLTCLKNENYNTDPAQPGHDENPGFTGGPTVENASKQLNFIALQFEASTTMRTNESKRKALAKHVASAILKILDVVKN
jgi:hypothetical protein